MWCRAARWLTVPLPWLCGVMQGGGGICLRQVFPRVPPVATLLLCMFGLRWRRTGVDIAMAGNHEVIRGWCDGVFCMYVALGQETSLVQKIRSGLMDAADWIVCCAVGTWSWSCRGVWRYFVVMVTEMRVFGTLLYSGTHRFYLAWCAMWRCGL